MKFIILYISTLIFLIINTATGFTQDFTQGFGKTEIESTLPPLQTLIDSAIINNPQIRFRDLQVEVNGYKLNSEKGYWTRNLGMQADVRYGTFNNFSTNTSEGQSPSIIATSESQANYGIGVYMKFPLFDVINRKNQVGLAKAEVEQAQSMAESQRKEIRLMVIRQYNDVILKHRLFRSKSSSIETERINMKMVEEEFKNGVTPVVEYSRIHQIVSQAEDDLERARMDFIDSLMVLEEIAGFHFNIVNNISITTNENN
jgi:outer membrane protein TolC